jgi:hypothetical protein
MKDLDRSVRLCVYEHFARSGSSPSVDELAEANACSIQDVEASLTRLEADHHALALAPTTKNIWMAHPFSAVPTAFCVDTEDVTYWGNCAWDALAIPPLLSLDASVSARSAETGERMELTFRSGEPVSAGADGVVHFLVPPRRFWENIGYT